MPMQKGLIHKLVTAGFWSRHAKAKEKCGLIFAANDSPISPRGTAIFAAWFSSVKVLSLIWRFLECDSINIFIYPVRDIYI